MNRRNFLKAASVAPAASVVGGALGAETGGAMFTSKIVRLNLQHTWTTTMSSSQYRDTVHTTYTRGGITGHGEGAPIVRYHEDAAGAQKALEGVHELLVNSDPMQYEKIMAEVFKAVPGNWAGKSAVDIALM